MKNKKLLGLLLALVFCILAIPLAGFAIDTDEAQSETQVVETQTEEQPEEAAVDALEAQTNGTESNVKYIDADGNEQTHNCTVVTNSDTEWSSSGDTQGWYVVDNSDNIKIKTTVTCVGAVHLILKDGANLTVQVNTAGNVGICVSGDTNSLTVYAGNSTSTISGTGTLTASGGAGGAGIGGGKGGAGSNITINGGTVTATGGGGSTTDDIGGGAGIGGGSGAKGSNITINGGDVKAYGGYDNGVKGIGGGAGIGGGSGGDGTDITINGGTVEAKGWSANNGAAAGIGGGAGGAGRDITINGGKVTATGSQGQNGVDDGGAGIGGGSNAAGSDITINGGTVTATGGYGNRSAAGIGGGTAGTGTDITIKGGTVIAKGGTYSSSGGAGIGGGKGGEGTDIAINGGDVTATGGTDEEVHGGAGIGGGTAAGSGITISGGKVTATGGAAAAGIGGGTGSAGSGITINDGTVIATGGDDTSESGGGNGIGGGGFGKGSGITIKGGNVTAAGGTSSSLYTGDGIGGRNFSGEATEIYVAAYLAVKADSANPPTTEIKHGLTTDIASDLAGKRYATVSSSHTIYLKDGKAHLDSASGTDITTDIASKGLSYTPATETEPATWTMNNFTFTTTAATALEFADSGTSEKPVSITINVTGTNNITSGEQSTGSTYGIKFSGSNANFTISGAGDTKVLNVVSGQASATVASSCGISCGESDNGSPTLTFTGLTANFTGGQSSKGYSKGAHSYGNITVGNDAAVSFKSTGTPSSNTAARGIHMVGSSALLKIEGSGKLVASCQDPGTKDTAVWAKQAPDAKAVATGTETELAWDASSKTYKNGEAVATDATLTSSASISVGEQSGALTYGTKGFAQYAVTYTGFTPSDATSVTWTAGSAPTGVGAAFSGDKKTLLVSTTAATPAGEYKFKVTAKNSGADIISAEATLTVDKAVPVVNPVPTGKDLVYNGDTQNLVTAGTTSGGTLQYALGNSSTALAPWASSIPTGTNASTYYVWYKVVGDANYKDTDPVCITVSIKQKEAALKWTAPENLVYNKTAKTPTVVVNNLEDDDSCTVTNALTEGKNNVNAGKFTFTASALSNANYKLPDDVTSPEYEITKATSKFNITPEGNMNLEETKVSGVLQKKELLLKAGATNDGTIMYAVDGTTFSDEVPTASSGSHTITYYIKADDNHIDSEKAVTTAKFNCIAVFVSNCDTVVADQIPDAEGYITEPSLTRDDYTLDGWYQNKDYSGTKWNFDTNKVEVNTTLYAKWVADKNEYSVTFDTDGGSEITEQTVIEGGKVTKPDNPTKAEYTFKGWFKEDKTTAWDFDNDTISAETTIYALWEANQVNVSVVKTIAEVSSNIDESKVDKITAELEKAKVENMEAAIDADCQEAIVEDALHLTEIQKQETNVVDINVEVKVEATKAENNLVTYELTPVATVTAYDQEGEVVKQNEEYDVSNDQLSGKTFDVTIPTLGMAIQEVQHIEEDTVKNVYHEGSGLTLNNNGTATVAINSFSSLQAETQASKYQVTFTTGGLSADTAVVVDNGNTVPKPEDPQITNYDFVGWFTDASFSTEWDFLNTQIKEDKTIYAKLTATKQEYQVKFNANAPASTVAKGSMVNQTLPLTPASGDKLTKNTYTVLGYTFTGWKSDGTGNTYTDEQDITEALTSTAGAVVELYAQWTQDQYTITFKKNSETATEVSPVKSPLVYEEKVTEPEAPTNTDVTLRFDGWYTDAACTAGKEWDFLTKVRPETEGIVKAEGTGKYSLTLYAKWTACEAEVVGGNKYETLAEAVENAAVGNTIKLLQDVSLSETLAIDKALTLDLNTKTLTIASDKSLNLAADVTVKNGKISGTVNANSGNITGNITIDGISGVDTSEKCTVNASGNETVVSLSGNMANTEVKTDGNAKVLKTTTNAKVWAETGYYWQVNTNSLYDLTKVPESFEKGEGKAYQIDESTLVITFDSNLYEVAKKVETGEPVYNITTGSTLDPGAQYLIRIKENETLCHHVSGTTEFQAVIILTIEGTTIEKKVYDGTTAAKANVKTPPEVVEGDDVEIVAVATFEDKNVGEAKKVTVNYSLTGGDAEKYRFKTETGVSTTLTEELQGNIIKKDLAITDTAVYGKIYDGNKHCAVVLGTVKGIVDGDDVNVKAKAEFSDENAAKDKDVTVTYTWSGEDLKNYNVPTVEKLTATITPKTLHIQGTKVSDKVYDSTDAAEVKWNGFMIPWEPVFGDFVWIDHVQAAFEDVNAGWQQINLTYTLTGRDAGNYTAVESEPVWAEITKRQVTLTSDSQTKLYDGTALTSQKIDITGDGFVKGEGADFMVTGSQLDAGKSVNTFGYQLKYNTKAENYDIEKVEGSLEVTKRQITITSASAEKVYDGQPLVKAEYAITGDGFAKYQVQPEPVLAAVENPEINGDAVVEPIEIEEGIEVKVTGSQTEVGSSKNTITYTLNEYTKAENYNITLVEGDLKVTSAAVSPGTGTNVNSMIPAALALLTCAGALAVVMKKRNNA